MPKSSKLSNNKTFKTSYILGSCFTNATATFKEIANMLPPLLNLIFAFNVDYIFLKLYH